MVSGSGMKYVQAKGYHPGMGICADVLCGSAWDGKKSFKAGDEVAQRTVIFIVEANTKQTATLARSVKTFGGQGGQVLRFRSPDGTTHEIPLLKPSLLTGRITPLAQAKPAVDIRGALAKVCGL